MSGIGYYSKTAGKKGKGAILALTFTIAASITAASYVGWAIWAFREARLINQPRFRRLLEQVSYGASLIAAVGIFFLLMGIEHLSVPRNPASDRAMIYGFAVMVFALWIGISSTRVLQDMSEPMRKAERMVGVLSDRIPEQNVDELGLTTRELEVVSVIASGSLTDAQIAEKLFISKATAATHVRNILKKSNLNNRRDLMLLGGWKSLDPSTRPHREGPTTKPNPGRTTEV